MIIEFVIIDKVLSPKTTGRKLDRNDARSIAFLKLPIHMSADNISTLSAAVKKAVNITDEEVLLRKVENEDGDCDCDNHDHDNMINKIAELIASRLDMNTVNSTHNLFDKISLN